MPLIEAFVQEDAVHGEADITVPWWSYGKTVLASAALTLVAHGRLQLDKPVNNKPFTLRQLLQHRAGLRCYGTLRSYHADVSAGVDPWSTGEMLRRVDADTLAYEPGQGWGYSNIGYLMVRHLIENATGEPIGQALNQLVLNPLGIVGVEVAQTPDDLDATAWGNTRRYHPGWVYHSLLIGSPTAAVLFLHRLLSGDLLPPELLMEMQDAHPVDGVTAGRPWRSTNYGLGLMIGSDEMPGLYVGHTGGGPGSTAAVFHLTADTTGAHVRPTAAAFAPLDDPGVVESHVLDLTRRAPII